jgi:hypothetical protein
LSEELQEFFIFALSSGSRLRKRLEINHWLRELFFYHIELLKPGGSFLGNGLPQVGYDLAIVPQFTRFTLASDLPVVAPVVAPVAETLPEANTVTPSSEPSKKKSIVLGHILAAGLVTFALIALIAFLQPKPSHKPIEGFSVGDISVTDPITIQAIGERTPDGVLAYWAFCTMRGIKPSNAQFFSTVDFVQINQIGISDEEVHERRNELLQVFRIKMDDHGRLLVPKAQAEGTKGVLQQVLGDDCVEKLQILDD